MSTTAQGPRSVYAADVDGDGDLDLLSASWSDDKIAWYENDGASPPGFIERVITEDPDGPGPQQGFADGASAVIAKDVNRDGKMDVISASQLNDNIAWYENDGNALPGFTARSVIAGVGDGPVSVAAGDLDGDGDPDLVAASKDDSRVVWYENRLSQGLGWSARLISSTALGARAVVVEDIDDDGNLDVLSASFDDDKISWYENNGNQPPAFIGHIISQDPDGPGGSEGFSNGPVSLATGDLDRDGDCDVLSASLLGNTLRWFKSDGGAPPAFWQTSVPPSLNGPVAVLVEDVDGDGDLDVLSAEGSGNREIRWHEQNSASFAQRLIVAGVEPVSALFAADLDDDGDRDVVWASETDNTIGWIENRTLHRSAVFSYGVEISTSAALADVVLAADVNSDGRIDVVSASTGDDKIAWYENNGEPSFPTFTERVVTQDPDGPGPLVGVSDGPVDLESGDIDGDGDLDLLTVSQQDHEVTWYESNGTSTPTFTPRTIAYLYPQFPEDAVLADVNGDGSLDVIAAIRNSDTVAWYENDGGSPLSFLVRVVSTTVDRPGSVFAADLDGDGDTDVLSGSRGGIGGVGGVLAWHENDGSSPPAFTRRPISTQGATSSIHAVDIDGDGDLDVVSASAEFSFSSIAWYENDGDLPPGFTQRVIASSDHLAYSIHTADLDGDGDTDVLASHRLDDRIAWYENDGGAPPLFVEKILNRDPDGTGVLQGFADNPFSVSAADLDGDGRSDVLSASKSDDTIAWYKNQGGQFALLATDTAQRVILGGQAEDLFRIEVHHRGRPGDGDLELSSALLFIHSATGAGLDASQYADLVQALRLYLDDGSGYFEESSDTLVSSVDTASGIGQGFRELSFHDDDPLVQVGHGNPRLYHLVVELKADAAAVSPEGIRARFLSGSGSSAVDRESDTPLSPETVSDAVTDTMMHVLNDLSCTAPFDLNLAGIDVSGTLTCEAGEIIRAGSGFRILGTGNVTLRAGRTIRLGSGFSVDSGGVLRNEIDPALLP